MDYVGTFSGSSPIVRSFQVGEDMADVGAPVTVGGSGNEGIALATTTSATNFMGITSSTATLVTAQQANSADTERTVDVIINHDIILKARLSGGATSGTVLTIFTVTTASTTGLDVVTGDDFTNFDEGTIFCLSGLNKGRFRKIVIGDATDATVGVAFPHDIAVGDRFIALPFSEGEDQFVQLTSDFLEVDASVAVNGTNANFRIYKIEIQDENNAFALLLPVDTFWNSANAGGGDTIINGTLNVTGAVTFDSTLAVTGNTTVAILNATGAVDFDTTLNVDGSTTVVALTATGVVTVPTGAEGAPSLKILGVATSGYFVANNFIYTTVSGIAQFGVTTNQLIIKNTSVFSWSSGELVGVGADLVLARDAANTLAQRNGTNAQTFNLYNTFTNSSNYERLAITHASNVITFASEAAGTGTVRNFEFSEAEIKLNQGTNDAPFFNFTASADADATSAISTLTTSGSVTHHIQFEINGTTFWIAGSTTDPS